VGAKVREVDGYKLWYSGSSKARNGLGILVDKELVNFVVEVRHKSDRIMAIKVVVGSEILNVISVYTLQIGLPDNIKKQFWENLDMVIQDVPRSEKLFVGGEFNGHIGVKADGPDMAHRSFGHGERNNGGFPSWTLRSPMVCLWQTPFLRRRRTTW